MEQKKYSIKSKRGSGKYLPIECLEDSPKTILFSKHGRVWTQNNSWSCSNVREVYLIWLYRHMSTPINKWTYELQTYIMTYVIRNTNDIWHV